MSEREKKKKKESIFLRRDCFYYAYILRKRERKRENILYIIHLPPREKKERERREGRSDVVASRMVLLAVNFVASEDRRSAIESKKNEERSFACVPEDTGDEDTGRTARVVAVAHLGDILGDNRIRYIICTIRRSSVS